MGQYKNTEFCRWFNTAFSAVVHGRVALLVIVSSFWWGVMLNAFVFLFFSAFNAFIFEKIGIFDWSAISLHSDYSIEIDVIWKKNDS